MYIEKINRPSDVKRIARDDLKQLADEMRQALLTKLSRHGGHIGPNLGMVEATVALPMCLIHRAIKWCMMFPINLIRTKC